MLTKLNKDKIIDIAKNNGISYVALFGSHAREEQQDDSDVDLLVEFEKPIGLLKLINVELQFTEVIGKKVDLVTKSGMSRFIKPYIQDDLQVIYAKKS